MRYTSTAVVGALATAVSAQNYLGFNSGATKDDGSAKFKADFVQEFNTAKNLAGSPGDFNAVRLYTNIQSYGSGPIEAFEAAIETNTKLLLGVWCSGVDSIDNELSALQTAVETYGSKLTDLVIGISIGSEDLYRDSAVGRENDSGVGNSPQAIIGFIEDFKKTFKGSTLSDIPIGHVETADVWPNGSVSDLISVVDFMGLNGFPYYENERSNDISNGANLFAQGIDKAQAVSQGKPLWITETGWPYIGPDWDEAEATVANAKTYWEEVGCDMLFGQYNTFWYNLRDSNPENDMKFAITEDLSTKPRFDLSCPKKDETTSSSSQTATKTNSEPTGTGKPTATDDSKPTATGGSNDDNDSSDSPSNTGGSGGPAETGSPSDGSSTETGAPATSETPSESEIPEGSANSARLSAAAALMAAVAYFL